MVGISDRLWACDVLPAWQGHRAASCLREQFAFRSPMFSGQCGVTLQGGKFLFSFLGVEVIAPQEVIGRLHLDSAFPGDGMGQRGVWPREALTELWHDSTYRHRLQPPSR